jgi:UDP-N-acetylglucosamine--N-acetylmuramyl-(pentapeptide) pyrophosphoryl-undecaprenol N-acetylglucosamine transferase
MKKRIVIAGGGTGGHVYPALAVAQALEKIDNNIEVSFIGTKSGIEAKVIPKTKYKINYISVGKLNRSVGLLNQLKTISLLPVAFLQTLYLFIKLRPVVVLGVGGYVSAPFVYVASLLRCPTAIWEPNAYPGLANRILSPKVDLSLVVFAEAQKNLRAKKTEVVGVPVREEIEALFNQTLEKEICSPFKVLIFGGSQGARGINNVVVEALKDQKPWHNDFEFIHQIGSTDFQKIDTVYKNHSNEKRKYVEFIHDMHEKYNWANAVLCRSGASTIAELMTAGKPSVLVPFPHSSDEHQLKNAQALSSKQGALLIEQKDFNEQSFKESLEKLKNNLTLRESLKENIKKQFISDSARKIAIHILGLVRKS